MSAVSEGHSFSPNTCACLIKTALSSGLDRWASEDTRGLLTLEKENKLAHPGRLRARRVD